jgi:hypothetical protein
MKSIVNEFIKDIMKELIIAGITFFLTLILVKLNIIPERYYSLLIKAAYCSIPLLFAIGWMAFRIYCRQEILKIQSTAITKTSIAHWAYLTALVNEYVQKNGDKEKMEVQKLKTVLTDTYTSEYRKSLTQEIRNVFPKKTEPQVQEIIKELTGI